jgi:hypothetical protein
VPATYAEPDEGTSLRGRIDAAQNPPPLPSEDSLDAIRDEAMRALEEARSLKEQPEVENATASGTAGAGAEGSSAPILDYSPSVPAPVTTNDDDNAVDDEDLDGLVQSRYSRNSAKLPRLGIEPGAASSTIADLRRQMTADG